MFLSSEKIKDAIQSGEFAISPFSEANLNFASYDFTLDKVLKVLSTEKEIILASEGYALKPGEFVVGKTVEKVDLKNKYLCLLSNKKTHAEKGINILLSSTVVEPNTAGQLVIEICNNGPRSVHLFPDMVIAKGIFSKVS